jgi:hypothetical protein
MLRYLVRGLESADRDAGGKGELPCLVPLVVYHGAEPWRTSPFLTGLVRLESLGSRPLDFEMVVVDLGAIDDVRLSSNATLRAGLLLLKVATRPAMQAAKLGEILAALRDAAPGFRPMGVRYIMETYEAIDRARLLGEYRRAMSEKEEPEMATIAQELRAEGRDEGWKDGRAEGRNEGRNEGLRDGRNEGWREGRIDALLSILAERFGELPEEVRARVHASEASQVDVWLQRAWRAPSLDAVFETRH